MREYTNLSAAKAFLRRYYALCNLGREAECEHGHLSCSTKRGGPCFNEVLAEFPELDYQDDEEPGWVDSPGAPGSV